jgi:PKD repeat protein
VDASGSTGTIASYHWDWDDESATDTTVATASHTFAWDDTFNIHLRVIDTAGRIADVTHPGTVALPPSGPTAAFSVSCTDRSCSVDASGSSGTIASYHWDWDDETITDAAVPTATHTYVSNGTFAIHLRVTDATGGFGDVTHTVTVALPPSGPTAAFTVTCTNRTCTVNASASSGAIASYHWDWDDETFTDATVPTASHTFPSDGTFSIHLRVTDGATRFADVTHPVTVQAPPVGPTAAFTVTCTDRTCNVNASASTGAIATYHWDWDDELTSEATVPTASHTFPYDGTFTIRLTVTDTSGATAEAARAVTVLLPVVGPTASFTYSCSGKNCSFNASGSSGPAAITNYHWDWDDESTTDTAAPTASHRYRSRATFRVHLAVTDANGNTGRVTRDVVVQ